VLSRAIIKQAKRDSRKRGLVKKIGPVGERAGFDFIFSRFSA
jgi:hypothetical protein